MTTEDTLAMLDACGCPVCSDQAATVRRGQALLADADLVMAQLRLVREAAWAVVEHETRN